MSDWYEADEILRLRQASLKKEEMDLQIEYEKMERERNLHIRELKRIYNEDHSRSGEEIADMICITFRFFLDILDFKIILSSTIVIYF